MTKTNDLYDQWRAAGLWPISMCRYGDRLDQSALRLDREAIRMLIKLRPRNVPAAVKKIYRDNALREIASWLRALVPGISDRRIANMVGEALSRQGKSRPRALTGAMFEIFSEVELEQLKSKISEMLSWLEPAEWPQRRQIATIIT